MVLSLQINKSAEVTTEQTPSADEDGVIQFKAAE